MEQDDEQNLIRKSAAGDHHTFRQLVESHQAFAYRLAYRFLRTPESAEDIVQEAFIKVWNNLTRYDPSFRFKTWLGKIVTNLCLDHLKRARNKWSAGDMPADFQEPSGNSDALEAAELKKIITDLADQLTEKQKAVFVLRDLELMTPEEVCSMLSMSLGNVKSNLYYARIKIKQGLEMYYQEKKSIKE